MNGGWEMVCAALAGVGVGVVVAWICWRIFAEEEGEGENGTGGGAPRTPESAAEGIDARSVGVGEERRDGGAVRVVLEPEVTQEDVRSFYAKLDAVERNVPVALVTEWKQLAAEKMAAVRSAEEFAFEQGRLAAFGEMERAFLELADDARRSRSRSDTGEEGEDA